MQWETPARKVCQMRLACAEGPPHGEARYSRDGNPVNVALRGKPGIGVYRRTGSGDRLWLRDQTRSGQRSHFLLGLKPGGWYGRQRLARP